MSRQGYRYISLVFMFAAAGFLIWLGDDQRIFEIVPARKAGYGFAVLGVAGLLGLNIWYGGLLDKRKDTDAAGNALREGIPRARLIMTAITAFAGIILAVYLFVPIGGTAQDDLKIGKYRITADFPCRPRRHKQVVGKTETGDEVSQTGLLCSQGDVTYSLTGAEYSEQVLKSLPADAWASRTLDGLRSQPHYTHESSSRLSHQSFPAIRMHFSDSRAPPMDM